MKTKMNRRQKDEAIHLMYYTGEEDSPLPDHLILLLESALETGDAEIWERFCILRADELETETEEEGE